MLVYTDMSERSVAFQWGVHSWITQPPTNNARLSIRCFLCITQSILNTRNSYFWWYIFTVNRLQTSYYGGRFDLNIFGNPRESYEFMWSRRQRTIVAHIWKADSFCFIYSIRSNIGKLMETMLNLKSVEFPDFSYLSPTQYSVHDFHEG